MVLVQNLNNKVQGNNKGKETASPIALKINGGNTPPIGGIYPPTRLPPMVVTVWPPMWWMITTALW